MQLIEIGLDHATAALGDERFQLDARRSAAAWKSFRKRTVSLCGIATAIAG